MHRSTWDVPDISDLPSTRRVKSNLGELRTIRSRSRSRWCTPKRRRIALGMLGCSICGVLIATALILAITMTKKSASVDLVPAPHRHQQAAQVPPQLQPVALARLRQPVPVLLQPRRAPRVLHLLQQVVQVLHRPQPVAPAQHPHRQVPPAQRQPPPAAPALHPLQQAAQAQLRRAVPVLRQHQQVPPAQHLPQLAAQVLLRPQQAAPAQHPHRQAAPALHPLQQAAQAQLRRAVPVLRQHQQVPPAQHPPQLAAQVLLRPQHPHRQAAPVLVHHPLQQAVPAPHPLPLAVPAQHPRQPAALVLLRHQRLRLAQHPLRVQQAVLVRHPLRPAAQAQPRPQPQQLRLAQHLLRRAALAQRQHQLQQLRLGQHPHQQAAPVLLQHQQPPTTSAALPSQCSSYTTISDSTRLATSGSPSIVCDSTVFTSTPVWIRFVGAGGTMIVNSAPSTYRCNTHAPGWYTGSLPGAGGTVSGTVCYNWSGNTCNWSNSIMVTNCISFYVYRLITPPVCNLRYYVIDVLLRAGANINSVDNDGWTPLHAAAHWDKQDIIKFLLERNADIEAKNYAGQTPLDVCDGVTHELLKELKEKRPPMKSSTNETPDNITAPWKRKPVSNRTGDEHKSILRTESHNENNLETTNKTPPTPTPTPTTSAPQSSIPPSVNPTSVDENLPTCSPSIKEKLNSLQRSLHDLSNRYLKSNQDEQSNPSISTNNSSNNELTKSTPLTFEQRSKQINEKSTLNSTRPGFLVTNKYSQRTFTNPLQSLTTNNNINNDLTTREHPSSTNTPTTGAASTTTTTINIASSPTQVLDTKINRRWGTTDRTVGDNTLPTPTNTGPYVRRRSGAGVNDQPTTTATSTIVSVTSSLPTVTSSPTTNVTVTSPSLLDDSTNGKRRSNLPPSRDEEAEAQRKHRSAQARRERRSTQSVTVEDIKAAEQQIKSQPMNNPDNSSTIITIPQPLTNTIETTSNATLSNNKIGAPSTPSLVNEHDIETERLQRIIEEKKEKARILSGGNEDTVETTVDASSSGGSRRLRSRFTSADTDNIVPSITANDSLNLGLSASLDSQQQQPRRRTNRVHNQRKNTGRIIWNDETKEVEIRDDSNDLVAKTSNEESHRSDDQKLQDNAQQQSTTNPSLLGSRGLISRFENIPSTSLITTKDSPNNLSPTSPTPTSTSRSIRSQSQDPSRKSLALATSLPSSNLNTLVNGMAASTPFALKKDSKENTVLPTGTTNDASAIKRLHDDAKRKIDELTQKIDRLERDIAERDQMIEKLKTSQYIESSLDKREKRAYERKISELEEELKKMDSIKADNTRLKEENAALIRVISKLSK
ncbi:unnamed protein product [Adineta ricciae]|uniref:cGMP-dependent protein kinase interacting domain-containing protein n=1 Tax=Adineta ricciae TaxID=249248 RepID=A0A815CMM5_ADIRI|nr:unnamed protein product [Adineta ricciae]